MNPFPKRALKETVLIEIPSASAIASTISKPTLWRVPLYNLPGLPRPTMSHGCGLGCGASTDNSDGNSVGAPAAAGSVVDVVAAEEEDENRGMGLGVLLLQQVDIRAFEEGEEQKRGAN